MTFLESDSGKLQRSTALYPHCRALLTEDIVGRWKEYFQDLLNPTDTTSVEEAANGGGESSITGGEVTEAGKRLLDGRAPGMDEVCCEFLKAQML